MTLAVHKRQIEPLAVHHHLPGGLAREPRILLACLKMRYFLEHLRSNLVSSRVLRTPDSGLTIFLYDPVYMLGARVEEYEGASPTFAP